MISPKKGAIINDKTNWELKENISKLRNFVDFFFEFNGKEPEFTSSFSYPFARLIH